MRKKNSIIEEVKMLPSIGTPDPDLALDLVLDSMKEHARKQQSTQPAVKDETEEGAPSAESVQQT